MFNNNGYSLADIAAATGNDRDGFGGFGGDGAWILLLFILLICGWGNGGYGFNGGGGSTAIGTDIQRGFDQSALINGISNITNAINTGFSNAEVSRCNSQANILQTLNNNQANLSTQLNTIAMNQQSCCCENRAGLADLKYTIATEACADRAAVSDGIQTILDKLCDQEIEALKAQNQQLQMQSYLANLAASQAAQTAELRAGQLAAVDSLYNRMSTCPVPTMPVYGSQPIFTCPNNNNGCGCNGNLFYN